MRMITNPISDLSGLPIHVGSKLGYYKAEGITADHQTGGLSSSDFIKMLVGEQSDVIYVSPGAILNNAIRRGADVVAVAGGSTASKDFPGTGLIVSDKLWKDGVREVKDLKGQEINIIFGLSHATFGAMTILWLRQAGLDPFKDVKVNAWNSASDAAKGFMGGKLDVVQALQFDRVVIEKNYGGHTIAFDYQVQDGYMGAMVLLTRKWVQANREAVIHFLMGHLRATRAVDKAERSQWKEFPEIKDLIVKEGKLDPVLLDLIPGRGFDVNGRINIDSINTALNFEVAMGSLPQKEVVPVESYVDEQYVIEAAKRLATAG